MWRLWFFLSIRFQFDFFAKKNRSRFHLTFLAPISGVEDIKSSALTVIGINYKTYSVTSCTHRLSLQSRVIRYQNQVTLAPKNRDTTSIRFSLETVILISIFVASLLTTITNSLYGTTQYYIMISYEHIDEFFHRRLHWYGKTHSTEI